MWIVSFLSVVTQLHEALQCDNFRMCEVVLVNCPKGVTWCSPVQLRCTLKVYCEMSASVLANTFFAVRHNVKNSSCSYVDKVLIRCFTHINVRQSYVSLLCLALICKMFGQSEQHSSKVICQQLIWCYVDLICALHSCDLD